MIKKKIGAFLGLQLVITLTKKKIYTSRSVPKTYSITVYEQNYEQNQTINDLRSHVFTIVFDK